MRLDMTLVVNFLLLINTFVIVGVIILERRKPEKTIAWLLMFALVPPLAFFLYLFLGRDWKRHKLNEALTGDMKEMMDAVVQKVEEQELIPIIRMISRNNDSPLFLYNDIEILRNGPIKFKVLKECLEKAQHHIHLEYFIVNSDDLGNEIKEILIRKAREGVKVRFIIDTVGSVKTKRKFYKELEQGGVEVVYYSYVLAPLFRNFWFHINYRNHRKIVVVDGTVGFIGGINIGDEYIGKSHMGFWRDTHLIVKGDFVLGLQAVFLDDYSKIKRTSLDQLFDEAAAQRYFPPVTVRSGKMMQFAVSGPDSSYPTVMYSMLKMISLAEKSIYITSPYFVPSESILDALKAAALGGVDVRILFPGKYDHYLVYKASLTYLHELCRCGARIFLYDPLAFLHAKIVSVDGKVCTVGSANMDMRSFWLNYEMNAVIYDEGTCAKLDEMFLDDLSSSVEVTIEDFERQKLSEKFIQGVARIFSSLL